jgi:hypothetical protein
MMMDLCKSRGRPRKEIDTGLMFHMIKNSAPIKAVAKFLGVHRDTLYTNYRSIIDEARSCHRAAWRIIADEMHRQFLVKIWLKEEKKRKKRKYRSGYFNRWRPRPQR